MPPPRKSVAFTLAEVLITLGVIGVVASLTLPSIIQKQTEKTTIVKLKKAYSTLLNAYQLAQYEYGDPRDDIDWSSANSYKRPFLERLIPYLNVGVDCKDNIKLCYDQESNRGSHKAQLEKTWGVFNADYSSVLLKDGTLIAVVQSGNPYNKQVRIMVDINGRKKPNAYGHDTFFFEIWNNKLSPANAWAYSFSRGACKLKSSEQATGCAYWILTYENMNYLHCDVDKTHPKCE